MTEPLSSSPAPAIAQLCVVRLNRDPDSLRVHAEQFLHHGKHLRALLCLLRLDPSSKPFADSVSDRLRAIEGALHMRRPAWVKPLAITALVPTLRLAASQVAYRSELDAFFEQRLEEPLVQQILLTLMFGLIPAMAFQEEAAWSLADQTNRQQRQPKREISGRDLKDLLEFLESDREIAIKLVGVGSLPKRWRDRVTATIAKELVKNLQKKDVLLNPAACNFLIHALVLVCKALRDPSTDLLAVSDTIQHFRRYNLLQEARSLAEQALSHIRKSQPAFLSWRTAQSWFCAAEAFLRSHNTIAAARCFCLGMLAHEKPALHKELLQRTYRLAGRILRDMRAIPMAFACAALERRLISRYPKEKRAVEEVRLHVFELQIRLCSFTAATPAGEILELLTESESLLAKNLPTEEEAILALQAGAMRLLRRLDSSVPVKLWEEFERRTARLPPVPRDLIQGMVASDVSLQEFRESISALPGAIYFEDLATHINPLIPFAHRAIEASAKRGDPELFLLAATVLAQPALALEANPNVMPDRTSAHVAAVAKWNALLSRVPDTELPEPVELAKMQPLPRFSFRALNHVSVERLQRVLAEGELAIVFAEAAGFGLFRMLVWRSGTPVIERLDENDWSSDAFKEWRSTYLDAFIWEKPKFPLDPHVPRISSVRKAIEHLTPGPLHPVPTSVVILPDASRFGFCWNLAATGSKYLSQVARVSIAPSPHWLIAAREQRWTGYVSPGAWFGSRKTKENMLQAMKDAFQPDLQKHGVQLLDADRPEELKNRRLAFVFAHGSDGMLGHFTHVSDGVNRFTPQEFSAFLSGCGCVILAVCTGGRTDPQTSSEETLGLVSQLLRNRVRCVVAAPWPLPTDIPREWFPAFMAALEAGQSAGEAFTEAAAAVLSKYDHPCAWGQLHLYGDSSWRLTRPAGGS